MSGDYVLDGLAVPESLNLLQDLLEEVGQEHPELAASDLMLFETAVIEVAGGVVERG
jgi:serine/threonine-protein kinase RsbW